MLTRMQNTIKCYLPSEEIEIMSILCSEPWNCFYVQGGIIDIQVQNHVYKIQGIIIEATSKVMVMMDSEEIDDNWEIFRLGSLSESEIDQRCLINNRNSWDPPIQKLAAFPSDLNLGIFLNVRNNISLLRFSDTYNSNGQTINEITDSGMLISNSKGRLLIFNPIGDPIDFFISTNDMVIDSALKDVEIIPLQPSELSR